MPIEDLIQRDPKTLGAQDTCEAAARAMRDQAIGCVVIEEDGRPIGIVTDRDLAIRVMATGDDPSKTPLESVMSGEPIFLKGRRSIEDAIQTMSEHRTRRLLLVDEKGRLEGVVSFDDLLPLLARQIVALAKMVG